MTKKRLPAPLKKGDAIGVAAPAGQLHDRELFYKGLKVVEEMGFEVKFPRELWAGNSYVADTDERRVAELHELFSDSDVKAIIAARGGFGCLRILPRLNKKVIAENPKFFVGFSDVTILQNYLYQTTNLISLHGPTICSLSGSSPSSLERLYRSLVGGWDRELEVRDIEIIQDGPAVEAELVGGNLASIVSMLGTPFDCSWENRVVFLEDTNEPLYKIDRMVTQLELAGKFNKVAGILLGDFSSVTHDDSIQRLRYLESIWERFRQVSGTRQIPVWGNFPSGHCRVNYTFPVGAITRLDKERKCVLFK